MKILFKMTYNEVKKDFYMQWHMCQINGDNPFIVFLYNALNQNLTCKKYFDTPDAAVNYLVSVGQDWIIEKEVIWDEDAKYLYKNKGK